MAENITSTTVNLNELAVSNAFKGYGTDNSNVVPENTPYTASIGWMDALASGAAARRVKSVLEYKEDCTTGDGYIVIGKEAYTTLPEDTGGACCYRPSLEMEAKQYLAKPARICMERCYTEDELDTLKDRKVLPIDANPLALTGTNWYERDIQEFSNLATMFLERTVALGQKDISAPLLRPFPGLLDVINKESTITLDGSNLLSTIKTIDCTDSFVQGDWLVLGNAIGIKAFNQAMATFSEKAGYTPGFKYQTQEFKSAIFSLESMTTELWILDLNKVGLILDGAPTFNLNELTARETYSDSDPCYQVCVQFKRRGFVFSTGLNSVFRVQNVGVGVDCASVIGRFAPLANQFTLIPSFENEA